MEQHSQAKNSPEAAAQDEFNTILVVDDEETIRQAVIASLARESIVCIGAATLQEAIEVLSSHKISLLLLDWSLRGAQDTSGAEVLRAARKLNPWIPVIVM